MLRELDQGFDSDFDSDFGLDLDSDLDSDLDLDLDLFERRAYFFWLKVKLEAYRDS